jgi:hypothetical protein
LTWSSFDAHISDAAPPGNLIWPVLKSPRMDLTTGIYCRYSEETRISQCQ